MRGPAPSHIASSQRLRKAITAKETGLVLATWDGGKLAVAELAPGRPPDNVRVAVHGAVGLVNGYADGRVRPSADVAAAILAGMVRCALDAYVAA